MAMNVSSSPYSQEPVVMAAAGQLPATTSASAEGDKTGVLFRDFIETSRGQREVLSGEKRALRKPLISKKGRHPEKITALTVKVEALKGKVRDLREENVALTQHFAGGFIAARKSGAEGLEKATAREGKTASLLCEEAAETEQMQQFYNIKAWLNIVNYCDPGCIADFIRGVAQLSDFIARREPPTIAGRTIRLRKKR